MINKERATSEGSLCSLRKRGLISLTKYCLVVIQFVTRQHTVSTSQHFVKSPTFVSSITLWSLTPIAVQSPFLALKVCLLESLDSDLKIRHSTNCFIRARTEQTHRNLQLHRVRTDICSQGHFMVCACVKLLIYIECLSACWQL